MPVPIVSLGKLDDGTVSDSGELGEEKLIDVAVGDVS